jgi:glc operon protein GlcG
MVLRLREATRIIEGTIAKAKELGVEITVAICNGDGHLIAFNRMDGVSLAEANREAIGKAIVSATWGVPSEQPQGVARHNPQDLVYAEGAPAIRRRGAADPTPWPSRRRLRSKWR